MRRVAQQTKIRTERAVGVLLLVGMVAIGAIAVTRSYRAAKNAQANASAPADTTSQRYTDLFLAAWRQDLGKGNVLVEAVYFHPTLIAALAAHTQPSLAQRELRDTFPGAATAEVLPVYLLMSATDPALIDAFDVKSHVTLSSEATTYALREVVRLDPLNYQTTGIDRAFLLTFDGTAFQNIPLTLRMTDLDGVPVREFYWDVTNLLPEASF